MWGYTTGIIAKGNMARSESGFSPSDLLPVRERDNPIFTNRTDLPGRLKEHLDKAGLYDYGIYGEKQTDKGYERFQNKVLDVFVNSITRLKQVTWVQVVKEWEHVKKSFLDMLTRASSSQALGQKDINTITYKLPADESSLELYRNQLNGLSLVKIVAAMTEQDENSLSELEVAISEFEESQRLLSLDEVEEKITNFHKRLTSVKADSDRAHIGEEALEYFRKAKPSLDKLSSILSAPASDLNRQKAVRLKIELNKIIVKTGLPDQIPVRIPITRT